MMPVQQALSWALQQGASRLEAQMLLLHILGQSPHARAWLLTHADDPLTPEQHSAFVLAVKRRLQHEPVAYITGHKEFFGLDLQVDARVLDPRADTEILVEWALACLADTPSPRVLDLGTGSGAIALAIQQTRPDAQVVAVDASTGALTLAAANAQRLGLPVGFYQGSWFSNWQPWGSTAQIDLPPFDLIVSNPPYVAQNDPHLAALKHEPLSALASGEDGLDDIRRIVAQALPHLISGGHLLLEHGFDQAQAVQDLLGNHGFVGVQSRPDLAGILRCSGGHSPRMK